MVDPYVYENTDVLKNKLGIKNKEELDKAESDISFSKILSVDSVVVPKKFDLEYLQEIHKYLFGDIYEFAGEIRKIPIEKPEVVLDGMSVEYVYPTKIEEKAKECLKKFNSEKWDEKNIDDKSIAFSKLLAELWQIHPFREGNTRTIATFVFKFAKEHNFEMDEDLLLNNFKYVRRSLVMACIGEYSDYNYLIKIIKDSIQRGQNKKENNLKESNEQVIEL